MKVSNQKNRMAKETQALKAHIDSKRWKKIIYANDNKKKPQRHNFPIKLPVPGFGPILRCNQLCFKHFGERA